MSQKFSLQQRLLTRTLGGVLIVWVATAAYVWFEAQHEIDELLDAHLAQSAALLVVQQSATPEDDEPLLEAPTLHKYAHRVAYQVFDENRLVMHSPNVGHAPMAQHTQGFETVTLADGKSWRIFAAPGRDRDVQVYVAERVDSRDEILRAVMLGFLRPLTFVLPPLLMGLWWNVRSGLQPLQRLRQVLLNRDTQTLTPVSLPDTPQEVQPMLDALNDLLQRLAQRMQTERRFTADAAHELRTPIAAIRAQAQVALTSESHDMITLINSSAEIVSANWRPSWRSILLDKATCSTMASIRFTDTSMCWIRSMDSPCTLAAFFSEARANLMVLNGVFNSWVSMSISSLRSLRFSWWAWD